MIKSGVAVVILGLVGLFGYYYISDRSEKESADKAKDALAEVGDTVVDRGVASLVSVRLKATFGLEAARYLHVDHDEGRVIVYGLVPERIGPDAIRADVLKVPGVKDAQVLVLTRPVEWAQPVPDAPEPPAGEAP